MHGDTTYQGSATWTLNENAAKPLTIPWILDHIPSARRNWKL